MKRILSIDSLNICTVISTILVSLSCSVRDNPQSLLDKDILTSSTLTVEWESQFGGDNFDRATKGVSTSDGGVIVIGKSDSQKSGDKSEPSKGSYDIWVVRLDKDGKKVWDRTIGGNQEDEPHDIIATSDGGYIIIAESASNLSGDKTENRRITQNSYLYTQVYTTRPPDFWIIKIDENGKKLWDKTIGGFNTDIPHSISATNDGGFIIAGVTRSEPSFPIDANLKNDKTESSRGVDDFWVIKISADGQKTWDKTFGGLSSDVANKIISTKDGEFIIVGTSSSNISIDKSENKKGIYDYWILKISSTGQKIWDKTFGGDKEQYAQAVALTKDGGVIIGGYSYSDKSIDKSENKRGKDFGDFWIVKIAANGQKIWDKTFGGDRSEYLKSVFPTSDGGFLLAGTSGESSSSPSFDKTNSTYGLWVIKINDFGVKQSDWSFENVYCNDFITNSKGSYYNIGPFFENGKDEGYKITKLKF